MSRPELRQSGIDGLGELEWGTHFCHLHETPSGLLATVADYLLAGVTAGESCLWLVPEPISVIEGWRALEHLVPSLESHRAAGHIELTPSGTFCYGGGGLDVSKVLAAFDERLGRALSNGRAGLRVAGALSALVPCRWHEVIDFEGGLNQWIAGRRMILLCNYILDLTSAAGVVDIVAAHEFAACTRGGRRERIEARSRRASEVEPPGAGEALEQQVALRTRELELANQRLTREIAVRRSAEQAAVRQEREFRKVFDEASLGIALFDQQARLRVSNRNLQRIFGYTAEQMNNLEVRRLLADILPPAELDAAMQRVANVLEGRTQQYTLEQLYHRKDGQTFWGNVTVTAARDDAGQPLYGIAMVEDVTERKQAEDGLARAQAELAHANRMMTMGELVASIAHEVNQPLAAVQTNAHACLRWLDREPADLQEVRLGIERIAADSGRAREVIQRIAALVKKSPLHKTSLDVNEVIREVLAMTRRELEKAGVSVRADLAGDLPPLLGDRVQLQQVLLNLMMNGVDAVTAAAGPVRQLTITSQRDPTSIRVALRDSGVGLDPATANQLFEAFVTTKEGGMGMGLSISRSIIEAHGGELSATANVGGPGATFAFTLPIWTGGSVLP